MPIKIANKLEVLPGNVINVPGCEPTSAMSSVTLSLNMKCKSSTIPLEMALEAIPGSYIEVRHNPMRWFFVLPSGPPTQPGCNSCTTIEDYYQMLRNAAPPKPSQKMADGHGQCDSFAVGRCE
ncbi:MAG: hypothetical protein QXU32_00590 [Nitrososphaerales archaeon]